MRIIINTIETDLSGKCLIYSNPDKTIEIDRRGIRSLSKYGHYFPDKPDEIFIEEDEENVHIIVDRQRFARLKPYRKELR